MTAVARTIDAAPDDVFAILADPWTYPRWVVGARRIREVEGDWPAPGAAFHHVVGVFPLRPRDNTEVIEVDPDRRLVLEARARPTGRAHVTFDLSPAGDGHTRVVMAEVPASGPVRFVPPALLAPLIRARNRETLERLEDVVHGRR